MFMIYVTQRHPYLFGLLSVKRSSFMLQFLLLYFERSMQHLQFKNRKL